MITKKIETKFLDYLITYPDNYNPDHSYSIIIMLHGYGASMNDLSSLAQPINSNDFIYIFPNAPINLNLGFNMTGYAWFPIETGDYDSSSNLLKSTINKALEEINYEKIFISGFSQGGMMAIHSGLFSSNKYDGVIILSSKLIHNNLIIRKNLPKDTKIFIRHGTLDNILNINEGRKINDELQKLGFDVDYKEYKMAHEINMNVINDLSFWLSKQKGIKNE